MTYPNGLKRTLALFSKAFYEIVTGDEIDKIIKCTKGKEQKALKLLRSNKDKFESPSDIVLYAVYPIIVACPHFMSDIISYMATLDDAVMTEEELKEFYEVKE